MPLQAILFIFLSFVASYANSQIIEQELVSTLSQHSTWKKLVYFSDERAQIKTPSFYLSGKSEFTPEKELIATVKAMMELPGKEPNKHAQCKFRARYYWLSAQAFWSDIKAPVVECSAYNEWSDESNITSLSVVFASGYLSNPASFFGHMLLKFNTKNKNNRTDLLNKSINYGAIIPPKQNPLVYIAKGLFGGYDAGFTAGIYYEDAHSYTNLDLRDVWEYRLNFTVDETKLLMARSWELLQHKFTYFYLTKNCGYRIAELLELVLDKPIFKKNQPWIIPVEIFRELSAYDRNGQPIVKEVRHHLSKHSQFYNKLNQLNREEYKVLTLISSDYSMLDDNVYLLLNAHSKIKILDVLLDYSELLSIKDEDSYKIKDFKRRLLQEMLVLSSKEKIHSWRVPVKLAPHHSQKPGLFRVGGIDHSANGNGFFVQLRAASFDLLTPEIGVIPYAALEGLNAEFEFFSNNRVKLKKLDIFNIETLGLPSSGLSGDEAHAWNISFGLDRPDIACTNCLTQKVEGGIGKAFKLNTELTLYGYAQGRLQGDVAGYGYIAAGIKSGMLLKVNPFWKINAVYQNLNYSGNSLNPSGHYILENRFGRDPNWDFRLSYEKQDLESVVFSWGIYF